MNTTDSAAEPPAAAITIATSAPASSGVSLSAAASRSAGQPGLAGSRRWQDPSLPVDVRVADLLALMTLDEKLAQLTSVWLRADNGQVSVAPESGEPAVGTAPVAAGSSRFRHGLGQLTRVFGTAPLSRAAGVAKLTQLQAEIIAASRFGLPAIAHEECLTGFTAWTATVFPTPLAWGASFNPAAVSDMAAAIGASMRAAGIHQGLAPVLDVVRDARWGRAEETIGEDPYLVGIIATAYVQGLQSAGVIATLKHFAGYSASRAGRNLAPVDIGPRELADVILPPFEMAIRHGGARSVMPSYTSIDGVPSSADAHLVTRTLREEFGFDGVVVSDYRAISFLHSMHGVAGSASAAAALALRAGIDVELPDQACYGAPLADAIRAGELGEELADRSAARVLRQKCELGMMDPSWSAVPVPTGDFGPIDLDPPEHRQLARLLAEQSIVLLANNDHALPLGRDVKLAVIGPLADDPLAFFGCYSFPRHLGYRTDADEIGLAVPTVLGALRAELGGAVAEHERGCAVRSTERAGIPAATAAAARADLVIAVLGDESGMFGRGTSGEGCDVTDLRLPGAQQDLLDALVETGQPVVLVLVTGRPYAIGNASALAAIVQAFLPGEEGGGAIAGVLTGRVGPSGKLPIELPAHRGAQPSTYLRVRLADRTDVSSVDPTPLFPFGHGLSYTTFDYGNLSVHPAGRVVRGTDPAAPSGRDPSDCVIPTDGVAEISCLIENTGSRAGTEVVQLYLGDPVASVARPQRYLAGFVRVTLAPGEAKRVSFQLHADRTAFHGRAGTRIVEPGLIEIAVGSSSADLRLTGTVTLLGSERVVGSARVLTTPASISSPGGHQGEQQGEQQGAR
jgi:beta-xylosidase